MEEAATSSTAQPQLGSKFLLHIDKSGGDSQFQVSITGLGRLATENLANIILVGTQVPLGLGGPAHKGLFWWGPSNIVSGRPAHPEINLVGEAKNNIKKFSYRMLLYVVYSIHDWRNCMPGGRQ